MGKNEVGSELLNGYEVLANFENLFVLTRCISEVSKRYAVFHLDSEGETWGGKFSADKEKAISQFANCCMVCSSIKEKEG